MVQMWTENVKHFWWRNKLNTSNYSNYNRYPDKFYWFHYVLFVHPSRKQASIYPQKLRSEIIALSHLPKHAFDRSYNESCSEIESLIFRLIFKVISAFSINNCVQWAISTFNSPNCPNSCWLHHFPLYCDLKWFHEKFHESHFLRGVHWLVVTILALFIV